MVRKVHLMGRISSRTVVHGFLLIVSFGCLLCEAYAKDANPPEDTIKRMHVILDDLEARLQMPQHVEVRIIGREPRMVAVQRIAQPSSAAGSFVIRLDEQFFDSLDEEELRAALAHELGHVWI